MLSEYNVLCMFYSNASDIKKEKAVDVDELLERERRVWTRACPAELYYQPGES